VSVRVDYSPWLRHAPSPGPDVAAVEILTPKGIVPYDSVITPKAVVYNPGIDTAQFATLLKIGTIYSESLSISLVPEAYDTLFFPSWSARPRGAYVVKCTTLYSRDVYPENDIKTTSVSVDSGDAPLIIGISPNNGGNTGSVTVTITGQRFQPGARVKLTKAGQPDIVADTFWTYNIDSTQIEAILELDSCQLGNWNLIVMNPDSNLAVFFDGFMIQPTVDRIWIDIVGRDQITV